MTMRWWQSKVERLVAQGPRRRLVRGLGARDREKRLAAAAALLAKPLSVEEVAALCPVLDDLASPAEGATPADRPSSGVQAEKDLAVRIVNAFGRARWRQALPTLVAVFHESPERSPVREAARRALDAIQPGLTGARGQASDASAELQPRTIMEKALLTRDGMPALQDYLGRMPLCGVYATADIPRTPREEMLRADRQGFGDRRLRSRDPDSSGTIDETTRAVIEGLYAVVADLGRKSRATQRSIIQPHTREGVPGLAEVRTLFGTEFGYVDLVARCDRDWFYYWGTEIE